jgi:deazaflavin-dependent oxidoreductase (nitroreductase family)
MSYLFGQEHVDRYIATDGEEGHDWRGGSKVLLLTATGRKSGREIVYPLIYGQRGDDYLLVASKGGAPRHPSWYLNLEADPEVEIQVKDRKMRARARTATTEEKAELWPIMTAEWPDYDDYQSKTDRDIPLVIVTPTGS